MSSPFSDLYARPSTPAAGPATDESPFSDLYGKGGGEGILSRAGQGVIGTSEALLDIAKGIPKFFLHDLPQATGFASGGLTQEQLANPIIRARLRSLGQDPDRIKAVSTEEAMSVGPIPFVKSIFTGPIAEAKAAGLAETPRERAKHAAMAAFLSLAPIQPFMKGKVAAKAATGTEPIESTIGSPQPTPQGPGPTLSQLAKETIEKASTKKREVSAASKASLAAYNRWRAATPEQRAATFPAIAAVADKPWKELTKEHKRAVRSVLEAEATIKALNEASAKADAAGATPTAAAPVPFAPKIELPVDKSTFTPLESELDRVHGNILGLESQARQLGPLIDNSQHKQFLERYAADLEKEITTERGVGSTRPQADPAAPEPTTDTNLGQDIKKNYLADEGQPGYVPTVQVIKDAKAKFGEDALRQEAKTMLGVEEPVNPELQGLARINSPITKAGVVEAAARTMLVREEVNAPRNPKAQAALEAKRAARQEPSTTPSPPLTPEPAAQATAELRHDVWYDKDQKMWVSRNLDASGNQVGNAEWFPTKKAAQADVPARAIPFEPTPKAPPTPGQAPLSPTSEPAPAPGAEGAPLKGPSALKLVDSEGPLAGKSIDELDALIDKIDEVSLGVPGELVNADLTRIAAAKKILLASDHIGAKAPGGQIFPELDLPVPQLRAMQQAAKVDPIRGRDIQAAANRGLRFNKTFDELGDRVQLHVDELKSMLKQVVGPEAERIQRRLSDATAELSRRAAGDITQHVNVEESSILRNEKGFIKLLPDPLEAHPDLSKYDPATARVLERVNVDKAKTDLPSWRQFVNASRFHLERKILPIEEATRIMAGGQYLPKFLDPGAWAQMYSGHPVRAEFMLTDAPFRWTPEGNIIISPVRGYARILRDIRGKIPEYRAYEVAAHTIELAEKGKATGVELADAIKVFSNAKPEIVAAARESVAFRNEVLKYWGDAGGVSGKAIQLMIDMYQHYTPFLRILEGKKIGGLGRTLSSKGTKQIGRLSVQQPVKRLFGSEALIQDPVVSTVDLTRRLIRAGDRNMIFRRLIELAEQNPELASGIIEKVPKREISRKALEAKQEQIIADTKKLAQKEKVAYDDETVAELVENLTARELGRGSDQIRFWRDGKAENWRVHPDIARAIEALDPQKVNMFVQLLSIPTRTARGGIVYNPLFSLMAAFKDAFEATIRSRYGFMPWNSIQGFGDALSGTGLARILGVTPTEYQRAFKAAGGAFSTVSGIIGQSTAIAVRAVLPGRAPVLTKLTHPVELLKKMSEPWEEAARIGEFRLALGKGKSVFEAALAAKTITVDFNMSGASMQGLNMITAFLNPAIQSFSADIRSLGPGESPHVRLPSGELKKLTPIELKELKPGTKVFSVKESLVNRPRRVLALGMGIALGTAFLWAANRDDEEINQLRKTPYGKLWWWFRVNGEIYKLPKPYFWGQVFASGAEAALDMMEGDNPNAARDWIDAVRRQVAFTLTPNLAQYGLAVAGNKDPLTGASIVPERQEDIDPMFQIRPNTSLAARKAGEWFDILNLSPIQVDFFIKTNFGTLGNDLNKAATMAFQNDARVPESTAAEFPFLNRIIGQYPSLNVEPLIRFRDRAADLDVVNNTVMYLAREQPELLEKYAKDRKLDIALAGVYAGARQSMNEIYAGMAAFDKLPAEQMTKEDRRARKDALVRALIKIADLVNQRADVAEQQLKAHGSLP